MNLRSSHIFTLACGLILLAGIALRLPGIFNDFWLDEIWALTFARSIKAPLEVFYRIHFDTNHWLYTLYLFSCGDQAQWFIYRLPALLAGILCIPMLALLAGRNGRLQGLTALLLGASSYLLTLYSSEARGYSLVILFSLAAFYTLSEFMEHRRLTDNLLFSLVSILGFMSHLTFLFPYAALAFWSLARFARTPLHPWTFVLNMLRCHLAPTLFFITLYMLDIRFIGHGGADPNSLLNVGMTLVAQILGLPESSMLLPAVAIGFAVLLAWEIFRLIRTGSDAWVFYLTVLLVAPALFVLASFRDFPFWVTRHFLVCTPFALLLVTSFICRCYQHNTAGKLFYIAFMTATVTGNLLCTKEFLRVGRGHYLDAVRFMASETPTTGITVGSDHDFRNSMMLSFYVRYLPANRPVTYCNQDQWTPTRPEWFIVHDTSPTCHPTPTLTGNNNVPYEFVRTFPYYGLSGWHWTLYRMKRSGG